MGLTHKLYRGLRGLTAKEGVPRGLYQPLVRRRAAGALAGLEGLLLDVGCGRGFYLEEAAASAPKLALVGIDQDARQLDGFTRSYLDGHGGSKALLVAARAETLPFASETFDVACCLNTLYNLPTLDVIRTFLMEMARVVKTGGLCIIDIRNRLNPATALRFKLLKWHDTTLGHPLRTYSASELESALSGTGLQIVRQHRIGALRSPFCPIIVFELEKSPAMPQSNS